MVIKQKSLSLPRKVALVAFGELLIVFSAKVNLLYFLYLIDLRSFASDKAKLFAKNVSKISNLDDSGIALPAFTSRTNLKRHNIHVTPKLVKKVITNLPLFFKSVRPCLYSCSAFEEVRS